MGSGCAADSRALFDSCSLVKFVVPMFSLAADPEQVEVPQWHKEILDQRETDLQNGRATVLEWEAAKKQIEQAIR